MLRVTVDLVPGGFNELRRTIATMSIINKSELADRSDYLVEAKEGHNPVAALPSRNMSAVVTAHHRHQSVWSLIAKAAAAIAKT
jgi:hypothetical protein